MNIEITPKIKSDFNKNWKKVTSDSAYLIPETIDDFESLGPFPYFKIEHICVYPKKHTFDTIYHLVKIIHRLVGEEFFSWSTVYNAVRDEIKLFFTTTPKNSNEWHLDHLLKLILSKSKRRLFVRSISGLKIEGFSGIYRKKWQIIPFTEKEISKFIEQESADNDWRSHVKEYLTRNYKDKICILVEVEGDLEVAKKKANAIAVFVINTLRYFVCIHLSHTGRVHDVGIMLDAPNSNRGLNAFSFDLEGKVSTMFGYGAKSRQEYILCKEHFDTIKSQWGADRLWDINEKEERNDLEASILSSIAWLGDAQQEDDVNLSYVKYWIAIESLLTGHKKEGLTSRIKNTIPIIISQFSRELPSKTEVDKAYELRCKVVHCGSQDVITINDLNKICTWATQCLSVCIHLLDKGYVSRDQIEIQIDRMSKTNQKAQQ